MSFLEFLLIGIGLAMDAFAVSVCRGLQMKVLRASRMLLIAATFGAFQALMPLIGYVLGQQFAALIQAVDHWIAFGLLFLIGGKMIVDVIRPDAVGNPSAAADGDALRLRELFGMALATSIDALAVGITFAFLRVNIAEAISVIGIVTFLICMLGVVIGHECGMRYQRKATLAGGIILIIIGVKILLQDLL